MNPTTSGDIDIPPEDDDRLADESYSSKRMSPSSVQGARDGFTERPPRPQDAPDQRAYSQGYAAGAKARTVVSSLQAMTDQLGRKA
jgi:hypothetical protein